MSTPPQPAPLRLGPYELVQPLASGGMAEVYLARRAGPHGFQKIVAVKRILPQLVSDTDFVAMFVDEARMCARLAHPNIVQVFDFGEHDGELYMAMEYVDGTTGARLIRAAASQNEAVPLEVSLHIALSVLRGLEYAHSQRDQKGKSLGLVHRDVSPGNVLIDRSGAVKLTDFGIARASEFERRTDEGQLKGKLGYMSPEQVLGKELDGRSDLFTVGIVLTEMITLRPLFAGGRDLDILMRIRDADVGIIDRVGSAIPEDVKAVLYKALARDRAQRFANAAAFADAIEDLIRRRRLQVGPGKLAAYIEKLGLAEGPPVDADVGESSRRMSAVRESEVDQPSPSRRGEDIPAQAGDIAPKIYRVRNETGEALAAVSYPRLVELFATGELGGKTLIAREGGEFKEAGTFTELARFVSSPALCWDKDPTLGSATTTIDRATMPSRIFQLAMDRETGLIMLEDGPKRKKIYLVEGTPEFVASTDRTELLGESLVLRGQVLRMEVDMALAMLPKFGGRLGDALVGLGVLRPIELFRAIHTQTQDRFLEMFKWQKGVMRFGRGARSQEETFPLGVDPFELIARGIRDNYDPLEFERMLSPIDEEILEAVRHPPIRTERFRFNEREAYVIRKTGGTLKMLIAQMQMAGVSDPAETMRAVFMGLSCQLLKCGRWTLMHPSSPPPRPSIA